MPRIHVECSYLGNIEYDDELEEPWPPKVNFQAVLTKRCCWRTSLK